MASGSPIEVPNAPLQLLIAALKSRPAARRFHITWSYNAFNYFSKETAIYDRKAGHLALLSTDTPAILISCSRASGELCSPKSSHDIGAIIRVTLGDTSTI